MFTEKTILIVDDDPAIVEMISEGLREHQFKVVTAADPEQAFLRVQNEPLGLALLDLDLGYQKMNGVELGIKLLERFPDLIVVIMTGYHNIKYAIQAMREFSFHYMIKPFRIDQIISLFERASYELELKAENQRLKDQIKILQQEILRLKKILNDIRPEEASLSVAAKEKEFRQKLKNKQALNSYQRQKG